MKLASVTHYIKNKSYIYNNITLNSLVPSKSPSPSLAPFCSKSPSPSLAPCSHGRSPTPAEEPDWIDHVLLVSDADFQHLIDPDAAPNLHLHHSLPAPIADDPTPAEEPDWIDHL